MTHERITAADVRPGDYIARAKTHEFRRATRVELLNVAVRLTFENGSTIRPAKTAALWRRTAAPAIGEYVACPLHGDVDSTTDFGWGVCRHGHGLQHFGDGYMTERVARDRAAALNAGRPGTDVPNAQQ